MTTSFKTIEDLKSEKVFDTRDLIEFFEDYKTEVLEAYNELAKTDFEDLDDIKETDLEEMTSEDIDFLHLLEDYQELKEFCEELEEYAPDYQYGEAVINRDYFVEYCKELCSDVGYLPNDVPSWLEIDWDSTADNLEADYTSIYLGDTEFLVR